MQRKLVTGLLAALALFTTTGRAGAPNVKGKISGYEKLVPEVYAETAKPESRRWTWREPSPSVGVQFRTLSANPSRDICLAATTSANQEKQEFLMSVTGGRVFPTTIVVTPNTALAFKNFDPFKHRIYVQSATGQKLLNAEDLNPNGSRTWSPQGAGKYEVRDELFPSIRTYILVDPQVAQVAYPGRDGAFGFALPPGDYVLKAFFNGKPIGKPVNFSAKDKGLPLELKEPLKLDEGLETK
ncbi:MAG: hypothetical protein KIT84_01345 [Labilithrix sp.]|nr:hypothetical protein [Labilithrix sp.]MCW5809631.1 hypothetical protein [Labilithrix sp.]